MNWNLCILTLHIESYIPSPNVNKKEILKKFTMNSKTICKYKLTRTFFWSLWTQNDDIISSCKKTSWMLLVSNLPRTAASVTQVFNWGFVFCQNLCSSKFFTKIFWCYLFIWTTRSVWIIIRCVWPRAYFNFLELTKMDQK